MCNLIIYLFIFYLQYLKKNGRKLFLQLFLFIRGVLFIFLFHVCVIHILHMLSA